MEMMILLSKYSTRRTKLLVHWSGLELTVDLTFKKNLNVPF